MSSPRARAKAPPLGLFVLKVASRCNLNCSYCYVYNQGDATWQQRPPLMSDATFAAALRRIRDHCVASGQRAVSIAFHGGEPCLIGARRFDRWCHEARRVIGEVASVSFVLQTNGTQLDSAWVDVLRTHEVRIGVSMDGPRDLHDRFRVDRKGRGSYDRVAAGVALLQAAGLPFGILSVAQFGSDPLAIHRHFMALRPSNINYLIPDVTHAGIDAIRASYGLTPVADFLIPIFDEWWFSGTLDVKIRPFWNIARTILGGESLVDCFGNQPLRFLFIEADGDIEGLDVLRVCEEGMARTGLNVHQSDFLQIEQVSPFHQRAIFDGMPLPTACRGCPEELTCGGGYLPHRYSHERGFDNASVWCADLLRLFGHIRERLGVPVTETVARRAELQARHRQATSPALRPAQGGSPPAAAPVAQDLLTPETAPA